MIVFLGKCQATMTEDEMKNEIYYPSLYRNTYEHAGRCERAVAATDGHSPPSSHPASGSCRGPAEGSGGWGAAHTAPVPRQLQRSPGIRVEKPRGIPTNCCVFPLSKSTRGRADPVTFSCAGVTGRDPSNGRLCTTVFLRPQQQPPRAPCQSATEIRVTTSGVYPACLQSH